MQRLLMLTVALTVLHAEAGPTKEQYREAGRRFKEGNKAYKLGNYVKAIKAFEEAYRLSEDPIVLFNIAQSYRKQFSVDHDRSRLVKARDLYLTFMHETHDLELRGQAETWLAHVEERLANMKDEPAEEVEPEPVPPLLEIQEPADEATPPAVAAPVAEVTTTERADPWYKNTWVWVAVGVVAVGAGAGAILAGGGSDGGGGCAEPCPTASVPTQ